MHGLKKKMHIKISKKGKTMRRILGIIKRIKKAVPHRPGKQRKVRKKTGKAGKIKHADFDDT